MPVMRPEKFHNRVRKVNTIARAEMAIRPGGRFVDIWRLLADDKGDYADRIEVADGETSKRVRVRAGDGIHLSVAGAHIVEAFVRERIVAELEGGTTEEDTEEKVGAAADAPAVEGAKADPGGDPTNAVAADDDGPPAG